MTGKLDSLSSEKLFMGVRVSPFGVNTTAETPMKALILTHPTVSINNDPAGARSIFEIMVR